VTMTVTMAAIVLTELASVAVMALLYRLRIVGIRTLDGSLCVIGGLTAAALPVWVAAVGASRMGAGLLAATLCACVVNTVYCVYCGRTWWQMRDTRRP
jgi:hypothetical protein